MKDSKLEKFNRRKFLIGTIPATCCLFSINVLFAYASRENQIHKFDSIMSDVKPTYRNFYHFKFAEFIKIMNALIEEWGKENVINFLKKKGEEEGFNWAQQMLKESDDNSFTSFTKYLDDPGYENTITFEFIERTDKVCEIKVFECIWAEVFKKANSGEIGYAYICHGDFNHCKTFNSKIKMIRDKTLMQGHDCCNHRYILES